MTSQLQASVTALIADDHPGLRAGFATALPNFGVTVLGEIGRANEVIARYDELKPDVLVLDIRFGEEMSGLDVAAELLKRTPMAKIVFLSQYSQESIVKRGLQVGGKGFVTKDCELEALADAIKTVHAGKAYYAPKVVEQLASLAISSGHSPNAILDERELEVFTLMAKGDTLVEIAEKLGLSMRTVSYASQAIKEKLNVHRPADITLLAIKYGLVDAERL